MCINGMFVFLTQIMTGEFGGMNKKHVTTKSCINQ